MPWRADVRAVCENEFAMTVKSMTTQVHKSMKMYRSTIAHLFLCAALIHAAKMVCADETASFNTSWISGKPEVLTYRTSSKQGDGLYQVAVSRTADGIEQYVNMITPGFTKSIWGRMTTDMRPLESTSRIFIQKQATLKTDCSYSRDQFHITTVITPNNQVVERTLTSSNFVVDFSQIPLIVRTLPLKPGVEFKFTSLNPQNNSLVPLILRVVGEKAIQGTQCYEVEQSDFEGQTTCWVEETGHHRIMRFEQPGSGRVTELIL